MKAQRVSRSKLYTLTSSLDWVSCWTPRPGHFNPRKRTWYPLYTRLGGPHWRYGRVRRILSSSGFDHHSIHPIAIRYTDCAMLVHTAIFLYTQTTIGKGLSLHHAWGGTLTFLTTRCLTNKDKNKPYAVLWNSLMGEKKKTHGAVHTQTIRKKKTNTWRGFINKNSDCVLVTLRLVPISYTSYLN